MVEFRSDDDVCGKSNSTATAYNSEVIFGLHQHTTYLVTTAQADSCEKGEPSSGCNSLDRTDVLPAADCLKPLSQHE